MKTQETTFFLPDDFESNFIEGLRKDYRLLQELVKEWSEIEQDPKLDTFLHALKEEFFNKQINPTGKLVVFTESAETANYLTEKVEAFLKTRY